MLPGICPGAAAVGNERWVTGVNVLFNTRDNLPFSPIAIAITRGCSFDCWFDCWFDDDDDNVIDLLHDFDNEWIRIASSSFVAATTTLTISAFFCIFIIIVFILIEYLYICVIYIL